jgi:hypothetical protein
MEEDHLIIGIHVTNRVRKATDVQKVLTEFGCNIKTRIGLHHVDDRYCSDKGLILIETYGDPALRREMAEKLGAIEGVEVKTMEFTHPDLAS